MKQDTNNKEQLICIEYKNLLKSINRHTVHTQLNKESKQLGSPPPKMAEKQILPRIARIRLAQQNWILPTAKLTAKLDTAHCILSGICNNVDNLSPKCEVALHGVNHIFNCSKNTTDLNLIDLWERPVQVANWLDLIP